MDPFSLPMIRHLPSPYDVYRPRSWRHIPYAGLKTVHRPLGDGVPRFASAGHTLNSEYLGAIPYSSCRTAQPYVAIAVKRLKMPLLGGSLRLDICLAFASSVDHVIDNTF